ncbi:hypothetical protein OLR69_00340, partial [Campylobacter jejuni]|nr:hypothetical protein [Campylobacter jejuni]
MQKEKSLNACFFLFFLSTLVLLFWRPWNLPIWVFSSWGLF